MMQTETEGMLRSGRPSRSALRVAIARAAHQLLDEPLVFDDPLALPILAGETEQAVRDDPFQYNELRMRIMRAAIVARSCFAEDELRRAVAAGVRQYVVLGAGLDTFALRNPWQAEGLRTFEVDHPSTQAWKRSQITHAGIAVPDGALFVGVDFEQDDLAGKLREAGFSPDAPACFSWLGVSFYLSNEAVLRTLAFVAGLPRGSSICFDYRIAPATQEPIDRMMTEHLAETFAAMGEPWKSSFVPDALRRELHGMGFCATDDLGHAELNARYYHRRKDGLQVAEGGFRWMCARV